MRRLAIVTAVALAAANSAVLVAGRAGAQAAPAIVVTPATSDPGGTVTVSNGPLSPCPPPAGTRNPSASVDLFAVGSATPVNRVPYQGVVTVLGTWSVEVTLAPDLPPGMYRVQAGCYTDSGLNARFGPAYDEGRLELRLQQPGAPTPASRRARAGESVQVSSGEARCTPPAGSPSPRVRVSLLDGADATRAEAEGAVDANGRWSVTLRVPNIPAQEGAFTAVCLARVASPAPYARYRGAPFTVEGDAVRPSTTAPATTAPGPSPAPGPSTSVPVNAPAATPPPPLPPSPVAVAIVAEPTYTG